jgi:hypothetical protein
MKAKTNRWIMIRIIKEENYYYIEQRKWCIFYYWEKITQDELQLNGIYTDLIKEPIRFKSLKDAKEYIEPTKKEIICLIK